MQLSSPNHPYVLRLVTHETEASNNKFNHRYDTIRLQTVKLHHFPWISICFICRFPLWYLQTQSSEQCFYPIPDPFWLCKDFMDRCEWRTSLKHVLLGNGILIAPKNFGSAPRNLHLVAPVLPKPKINFEPCFVHCKKDDIDCRKNQ